jgi:hypothetical protein
VAVDHSNTSNEERDEEASMHRHRGVDMDIPNNPQKNGNMFEHPMISIYFSVINLFIKGG